LPRSYEVLKIMLGLDFAKQGGLVPVIVQDVENAKVLMLGYMNELALEKTIETGKVTYWSRSRKKLWVKGETSGHFQEVREIFVDCDLDTLLIKVRQIGATCHEGYRSCFYRKIEEQELKVIDQKIVDPKEVYRT
jgi:phosphoribosyl-AMP cyclohydrolase